MTSKGEEYAQLRRRAKSLIRTGKTKSPESEALLADFRAWGTKYHVQPISLSINQETGVQKSMKQCSGVVTMSGNYAEGAVEYSYSYSCFLADVPGAGCVYSCWYIPDEDDDD